MERYYRCLPALLALAAAAFFDVVTGGFSPLLLYIAAVVCASWLCGRGAGLIISLLAVSCWAYSNYAQQTGSGSLIFACEAAEKGIILMAAALLVAELVNRLHPSTEALRHDLLTGLFTNQSFTDSAEREINRCSRYGHPFSIVQIDADNFTRINQTVGHDAGDALLVSIAQVLRENLRKSDIVARLGGDNFAILLPEAGMEPARNAVVKLKSKLDETVAAQGYLLTFSIGMVTYLKAPEAVGQVFTASEAAMLKVKGGGRNAIMHEQVQ